MKLNFWQWIGVALLVVGVAVWIYEHNKHAGTSATQPSSRPAGGY
jgi:type VI protein secretion system component VasK